MAPVSRHHQHVRRQQVGHWCDRAIIAGLGFVIVFGPFAFGAIHPWAYGLLEVVAALLVLVWVGKLEFWGTPSEKLPTVPREIWIPVAGFLSIAVLQVVPLPPGVLRVISPATYEMYATALPGWPDKAPYEEVVRDLIARDDLGVQAAALSRPVSLPTARDVERFGLDSIVPRCLGPPPGRATARAQRTEPARTLGRPRPQRVCEFLADSVDRSGTDGCGAPQDSDVPGAFLGP